MSTAEVKVEAQVVQHPTAIDTTPHGLIPEGFRRIEKEPDTATVRLKIVDEVPAPPKKPSILQEADAIAGEDRSRDYGHPLENHRRIAAIWSVQLDQILKRPLLPREVALMMIGLKLAREANSQKRDNLVDAAGYIKCVDMIDERIAQANNGV